MANPVLQPRAREIAVVCIGIAIAIFRGYSDNIREGGLGGALGTIIGVVLIPLVVTAILLFRDKPRAACWAFGIGCWLVSFAQGAASRMH